jgi:hypothetical protein
MKSSTRNLIIVAAVAVVLGGTVVILNQTGGGSSGSSSAASSSAAIQLISKSSENVASMKVTNKKGSYTLVPAAAGSLVSSAASSASSGSSASAVTYTVRELSGCPINTGETSTVVQNGFSLSATKNIGTASNLADYGLKDPQATVEVTFKDGSTFGYKIGNATATDSTAYYMCGMKSDNVYVVSIDAGLLEDANYFITKDMVSVSADTSTAASSSSSSSGNDFTQIVLGGSNFPNGATLQKNASGSLAFVSPASYDVDSNSLTSMESVLTSLAAESVAAVRPDAAALKKYGLDKPAITAEYTVNKKAYKLIVGAQNGKNYYAMVDGVNVVYNVSSDNINGLVSQNLFTLRSKMIFLPNITTVKKISVVSGKGTNEINVTRTENAASSTQDKKAYNYKVTGNAGKSLNYDSNYRNMYQVLIGLTVSANAEKMPTGSPAITVKYTYFDQSGTSTLALYQTDSRRYTAVLNGKVYGLCAKSDVGNVLQAIADFESGKTVSAG